MGIQGRWGEPPPDPVVIDSGDYAGTTEETFVVEEQFVQTPLATVSERCPLRLQSGSLMEADKKRALDLIALRTWARFQRAIANEDKVLSLEVGVVITWLLDAGYAIHKADGQAIL